MKEDTTEKYSKKRSRFGMITPILDTFLYVFRAKHLQVFGLQVDKINPKTVSSMPEAYTHIVRIRDVKSLVMISGQTATNINGDVVGVGDIEKQLEQVFKNLKANLDVVGASFTDVIKVTIYMLDIDSGMAALGRVRKKYFGAEKPWASTLVEIKRLARPEFLVEIEAIAAVE